MNEGLSRILMPGLRMPSHPMGHPVMGEIGPRRIAVFKGHVYRKTYIGRNASFPLGEIRLASQEKCASHKASP